MRRDMVPDVFEIPEPLVSKPRCNEPQSSAKQSRAVFSHWRARGKSRKAPA